jgi:hypothetical protein
MIAIFASIWPAAAVTVVEHLALQGGEEKFFGTTMSDICPTDPAVG